MTEFLVNAFENDVAFTKKTTVGTLIPGGYFYFCYVFDKTCFELSFMSFIPISFFQTNIP